MKKIEAYLRTDMSLAQKFDELADTEKFSDKDSSGAKEAIMDFVVSYLLEFSELTLPELREYAQAVVKKDYGHPLVKKKTQEAGAPRDGMVLGMLLDLRSTAALVQEIVFGEHEGFEGDRFVGLDLGSGSGILSVALAIAGARKKVKTVIKGIELQPYSLEEAERIVGDINENSKHDVSITFAEGDLTEDQVFKEEILPFVEENGNKVDFVVSETFNHTTPQPVITDSRTLEWDRKVPMTPEQAHSMKDSDPFEWVISNLVKYIPNTIADIQSKKTRAFPDFVNRGVKLGNAYAKIKMYTEGAKMMVIHKVGELFSEFQALPVPTYRFPDGSEVGRKMKNRGPKNKPSRRKSKQNRKKGKKRR